ncbi:uncharacterized protein N7473_013318 [Penicillium subrubescens]|uniref:uncharacterized protein n=1 Tax=Penicillium subrubescens TaxID=1316194 RepID=UPI0025458821|nr:uncharacterized protein N7473_013318 [Penicillium subrubescens]KAJ5873445.1 hypothetical protein N7473_013318 [Penicillium subrubescens]
MDDESPAVTGLVSILSALFGVLTVLFSYTWSFIYTLLYWLALPLLYLGRGLLSITLFPLQILLKFEAFLTFVTGAVVTGATVGVCLYFAGDSLSQFLRIQPSIQNAPSTELAEPKDQSYDWESKMFMSSTILEEEENSHDSQDSR